MRRVRHSILTATITVTAALGLAPVAFACPDVESSPAFARWGDTAEYVAVPGGAFENALTWPATGTPALVEEVNPFGVGGVSTTAVRLQRGDSITSPSMCITRHYPHLRFVLRSADPDSHLKMHVLWTDDQGKRKETHLEDFDKNKFRDWGLSRNVKLKSALPKGEAVRDIQLRFSVEDKPGSWLIDDVYIDPYRRN